MGAVGSAESVVCNESVFADISTNSLQELTDVDITQGSQPFPEFVHLRLVRLDLLSLGIFAAALLLGVETQVLE